MSVTLRDVADSLGVSTSTISRTLNGQGRISPATRKLILERMKEMGYTPNVNAQRLVSGRAYTIALDFGANPHLLGDMYFAELTRGIRDALQESGYSLLLNATGEKLQHLVRSQAVDGVIVFGGEKEEIERVRTVAAEGTPSVMISHCDLAPGPNFATVCTDLPFGACEVADFLVEQGHRRVAFLGSYDSDMVFEAFQERMARRGAPLDDALVAFAGPQPERAETIMREFMQRLEPPTVVFTRTDTLAAGALRAAHRMQVRVPQDVSVIGHDDVPFARLMTPALTTVRIDCGEMGGRAVEALRLMLDNPGVAMQPRIVRPRLVVRETVANLVTHETAIVPSPLSFSAGNDSRETPAAGA